MKSDDALILRPGGPSDATACAAIFDDWVDATDWMPRIHPAEHLVRHYREHVLAVCDTLVAERSGRVAGFAAVDCEGLVAAFFVAADARRRGVGSTLLAAAQARWPEGLALWTFAANAGARRFYARHGFIEARATEGDNEEGLPDLYLTWRAAA